MHQDDLNVLSFPSLGTHGMGWCLFSGRVFVNVQPDAADVQQGVAQSAASQQQKKCVVFKHFQMPEHQSETESVSSNCSSFFWTGWSVLDKLVPVGQTGSNRKTN